MAERRGSTGARAYELMCAAIIGALASQLFNTYWNLPDLQSRIIVGAYIVIVLLIVSFAFIQVINLVEFAEERRRHRRPSQ